MNSDTKTQGVQELVALYKTLFIELPVAGSKLSLGIARDNELEQVAWKAYDTFVRLANYSTNRLFANPFLGASIARALPPFLQLRRLADSMAGAVFAGLWSAVGLPASSEVQAIRLELQGLRLEFRGLIAALPEKAKEEIEAREEDVMRVLDARLQAWHEKAAA